MVESYGLEILEENFDNVVPEFGNCGGDTHTNPPNDEPTENTKPCSDCSCKEPKTTEEKKVEIRACKLCFKCKEQRATIKIKKEASCNDCFQYNVTHRFKNNLVRHCKVSGKDAGTSLVAVSGGTNSMAMLHLLWQCLGANKTNRKMFFTVHVLYIRESRAVFG